MVSHSRIFQGFLYCFLGAVFLKLTLSIYFSLENWWNYLFLLIGLVLLTLNSRSKIVLFLFFCFLGVFLGGWMTGKELNKIHPRLERTFSGYGYIDETPQLKENYQKLAICPIEAFQKESKKIIYPRCRERMLIFADLQKNYSFGEVIKLDCQLKNPENKYDKFDYVKFLAKDDIYQICQGAKIKKIVFKNYHLAEFYQFKNLFFKTVLKTKNSLEKKISSAFSYPESAYLAGLLLGGEDRLPEDIQENFRRTGTTHTIAVSGFNITILAGFFMILGVLVGFYRQKAFWLAVIGIIFFVLMIGSPSSAVRAAVMGILLLWAAKKGRLADSVQIIVLAGALMIAHSPLILFYDVGFQLSFLASLSIILIYGPLSERFNIKSDFLELKSILLVTISAQLGVLGIILYTFETFSPISLLANMIILPLIPAIMLMGFLTVLVAFINPALASLVALPTELALSLEIVVIEQLSKISWASLEVGDIGVWGLVGYYLIFLILVRFLRGNFFKKKPQ